MAATHGRLTRRPGVCLATLGPGALNLVTGAAYAQLGAMPMVMITGQKGLLSSRQAQFQIVDAVSVMRPLTKFSRQIVAPRLIPTTVREAFRVAQTERPGPVHLELPEDIAAATSEDVAMTPAHPVELPLASAPALDRAAEILSAYSLPSPGDVSRQADIERKQTRRHRSSRVHWPLVSPVIAFDGEL